jgi:hypothetical protein
MRTLVNTTAVDPINIDKPETLIKPLLILAMDHNQYIVQEKVSWIHVLIINSFVDYYRAFYLNSKVNTYNGNTMEEFYIIKEYEEPFKKDQATLIITYVRDLAQKHHTSLNEAITASKQTFKPNMQDTTYSFPALLKKTNPPIRCTNPHFIKH